MTTFILAAALIVSEPSPVLAPSTGPEAQALPGIEKPVSRYETYTLAPPIIPTDEPPSPSYTYLSIGGSFPIAMPNAQSLILTVPEVYFGHRHFFNPHHVIDYGMGLGVQTYMQLLYGQASYLYFPEPAGPYIGIGITLGAVHLPPSGWFPPLLPWGNVPVTIGYQFSAKKPRFIQLQVTPLRTGTISYGFGF